MCRESKLIILLSDFYAKEEQINEIKEIINYDINWGLFLYYAVHNRIVGIVFYNLRKYELLEFVENQVRKSLELINQGIKNNNTIMNKEICNICKIFKNKNIDYVLLKGGILSNTIYPNIEFRQYGDIDFLVDKKDIPKVVNVLNDLNYKQGKLNHNSNKIIEVSKRERIFHQLYTHELVDFYRIDSEQTIFNIDINHSLAWRGTCGRNIEFRFSDLNNYFEYAIINGTTINILKTRLLIIQLSLHLYSEAVYFPTHSNWIRDLGDINLIKFIDIYNIIKTNKINWYEIIEISNKHNIDDILLYVFIAINLIYHKTIPSFVIEALGKNNYDNIIDKYYDLKGEEHTWKMSFLDRLFYTESKKAEIKEKGLFNE